MDAADSHHCADVLRLETGDRVVIFDGLGNQAEAELLEITRKRVRLLPSSRLAMPKPRCSITLAQAVPKGKNMDLVLQKAVELGVAAVIPLLSERTVVRLEGDGDAARKQERWRSIVIEACKQCGQNWIPEIRPPCPITDFFSGMPVVDLLLIASLQPDSRHVKEVLENFLNAKGGAPRSVLIMIGPEGDFTPGETGEALAAGAVPVTLGPIVLRTETAAIYGLSVLNHELF